MWPTNTVARFLSVRFYRFHLHHVAGAYRCPMPIVVSDNTTVGQITQILARKSLIPGFPSRIFFLASLLYLGHHPEGRLDSSTRMGDLSALGSGDSARYLFIGSWCSSLNLLNRSHQGLDMQEPTRWDRTRVILRIHALTDRGRHLSHTCPDARSERIPRLRRPNEILLCHQNPIHLILNASKSGFPPSQNLCLGTLCVTTDLCWRTKMLVLTYFRRTFL